MSKIAIGGSLALVMALGLVSDSHAGLSREQSVEIDFKEMVAYGSLRSVRSDGHRDTYIGCEVHSHAPDENTSHTMATCHAQDAKGQQMSCHTWSSALAEVVGYMHRDTNIVVHFEKMSPEVSAKTAQLLNLSHNVSADAVSYVCTAISVGTHSYYVGQH